MLKNNKVCFVIALLVAVGLWTYVLGVKDPVEPKVLRSIPITFVNQETLSEENLVLLSQEADAVSVSFSGQRSVTKDVKAGDFKVTADLEGLGKGEHTVRLKVSGPEKIELEGANPQKIIVVIDNYAVAEKPVSVSLVNQTSDDSEPFIVQVSEETVKVKGAESLVGKVAYLKAEVDAEKVGNTLKAINTVLVPVDADGEEVSGVTCEQSKVSVTTVLHNKKTVTLTVPVIDNGYPDVTRDVNLPKTITIKGTDQLLSQVNEVVCEPIDISELFEDREIELVPILPDGIKRATNSEILKAHVTVDGAAAAEFTFDETDVIFEGVDENLMPHADSVSITVKISGSKDVIGGITEGDFILSADVEGLKEGEYTIPLLCRCVNNALYLEYNPKEIKLVISNEEGEA